MAQSSNKIVRAAAKVEATVGTDPTIAPADNGFLLFGNANPVSLDTQTVNLDPIRAGFTPSQDAIGRQLTNFTPTIFLSGSGAGVTPVRWDPLLQACALSSSAAGSSVTYKPISSSLKTAWCEVDLDGVLWKLGSCYGTFTMSGSAGQPVEINFNLQGVYNKPINSSGYVGVWTGGTNYAQTLKSANLIINNGTNTWSSASPSTNPLVFKSFNFDRGITVGERTDANAASGVAGLNVDSARPTLQLVVEAKNTLTGASMPDLFADLTAATTHAITWDVGTGAGKTWSFSVPTAQLLGCTPADGDGGTRVYTLDYLVQHATEGSEFSLVHK